MKERGYITCPRTYRFKTKTYRRGMHVQAA